MLKNLLRKPTVCIVIIILLFLVSVFPTIERYGIGYDEQIGLDIAHSNIFQEGGWLNGSPLFLTKTRLPTYFTAIIFSILKTDGILAARMVSLLLGIFTIIGVYVFCKLKYDEKVGLVACFLLAVSPFFLSLSRFAFSESDVFITCSLIWLMVCLSILDRRKTVGWAIVTAIVLGLALSSKISAISLFPAVLFIIMFSFSKDYIAQENSSFMDKKNIILLGVLLTLLFFAIFGFWVIAYASKSITYTGPLIIIHFLLFTILWLIIIVYCYFHRNLVMRPHILFFFILAFALLTFLVIPPVHTTNPYMLKYLIKNAFAQYVDRSLSFILEAASLHIGSVLFKSSLLMGAWFLLSFFITICQARYRKDVRLPIIVFAFYFLFVLKLPYAQTYYMMPLLPILAIFAADQYIRFFNKKQFYAIVYGFFAGFLLIIDIFLFYPDYNLNGYQWLGARYLGGRSTIGYRSIVQTTSDGIEQALKWANNNIPAEKVVVTYIIAGHIVRAVSPHPKFQIINGLQKSKPVIEDADYVITSINSDIRQGWGNDNPMGDIYKYRYDVKLLKANFTKVFSVKRAFGIEVAGVWRKNG